MRLGDHLHLPAELFQRRIVGHECLQDVSATAKQIGYLSDGHIVRLTDKEGYRLHQVVVALHVLGVVAEDRGLHDDSAELPVVVQARGSGLEPHHGPEVALQRLIARVVAPGSVKAVGILHFGVPEELRELVSGGCHVLHFQLGHRTVSRRDGLEGPSGEEGTSHGVVGLIVLRSRACGGVGGGLGLTFHVVVHAPREGAEHGDELLLLQLPKDKIEVHVEELEVEIGGDKAGEVVVVIVLVDVKELDVVLGHDHESVAGQCLLHTRGKGLELVRVGEVAQVHAVAFGDGEVLLQQLALAGLHSVDEGLLVGLQDGPERLAVFVGSSLIGAVFVPVRLAEERVQVLLHDPVALLRGGDLPVDAEQVKR